MVALHAYVVKQLAYLGLRLDSARMHLETQQPVVIPENGEPEPNAAIALQPIATTAKPRARDVSCVIEVAGTSLERDRTTKLRHYAGGGIPQYVILNLGDRTAEEYLAPDPTAATYARRKTHPRAARSSSVWLATSTWRCLSTSSSLRDRTAGQRAPPVRHPTHPTALPRGADAVR